MKRKMKSVLEQINAAGPNQWERYEMWKVRTSGGGLMGRVARSLLSTCTGTISGVKLENRRGLPGSLERRIRGRSN